MNPSELQGFCADLERALASTNPAASIKRVLVPILISDGQRQDSNASALVQHIAFRIDARGESDQSLLADTQVVTFLLQSGGALGTVRSLLDFLLDRERTADVLRKYLDGIISRTSLLSFVAERSWGEDIKERLASLADYELSRTIDALERPDIEALRTLFRSDESD